MAKTGYFDGMIERLERSANIKKVFGDPIEMQGKVIIPVARVTYGFGGGTGGYDPSGKSTESIEPSENDDTARIGWGEGGGGGVMVRPLGVIEITPERTRFLPVNIVKQLIAAAAFGLLAGLLISRGHK
ncbi:MAG: hypothetical protein HGA53_00340 [Anaerolineaceae bacterium]|nr:hypothetical protein [Anaerolineaceae bacterium]NTV35379.1 hypothetical protein [Anaerolineaceae bacterium]